MVAPFRPTHASPHLQLLCLESGEDAVPEWFRVAEWCALQACEQVKHRTVLIMWPPWRGKSSTIPTRTARATKHACRERGASDQGPPDRRIQVDKTVKKCKDKTSGNQEPRTDLGQSMHSKLWTFHMFYRLLKPIREIHITKATPSPHHTVTVPRLLRLQPHRFGTDHAGAKLRTTLLCTSHASGEQCHVAVRHCAVPNTDAHHYAVREQYQTSKLTKEIPRPTPETTQTNTAHLCQDSRPTGPTASFSWLKHKNELTSPTQMVRLHS